MARPDRSLSPADSYTSSRRSYRPRSRSPDRSYRGSRDSRDSRDRRDHRDHRDDHHHSRHDDHYRSSRRDRSRDRDRERDRYDRDDRRYRARESDYRGPSRPDDSRTAHRLSRDDLRDSAKSPRSPRPSSTTSSTLTTVTAAKAEKTEEQKRAERLIKLEEWKKKNAAEKQRQRREQIEKADPINKQREAEAKAAAQTGKFDPKAIAKKVSAASNAHSTSAALGGDINIKGPNGAGADGMEVSRQFEELLNFADTRQYKADSKAQSQLKEGVNVSGFNFGSARAQADSDKVTARAGLDFGEENATRRKLEKLPSPPPDDAANDASMVDTANGQENETLDDSEEESAAAARAALEKREQQRLADGEAAVNGSKEDTVMAEPSKAEAEVTQTEEDVDPLDAFMASLESSSTKAPGLAPRGSKRPAQETILFEADDEFATMEAANPDDLFDISNKPKKRREVATVDHSKMEYSEFRKNFYVEPSEVASMTPEEVSDLRLLLDGIKVRGANPPKPVTKWSHFGLGVQSLDVIDKLAYEKPTSIQAQAIPAIMSGRDLIGIAKTGSGKTISFLLPMFRHIKDQPPLASQDGPIGLILAPTRELVTQIHKDCKPWLKALNLRAIACYGGAPIKDQIAELKRGAEIVIATAGRMIDLLAANSGRVTNLKRTTYVVLDEADRMFDMGFEPQVMKIMNNVRPSRQTVMFSATFPKQMEALARKVLTKPIEIQVGGRSTVAPEIEQIVEVRNDDQKFGALLRLLPSVLEENEDARVLVFVDRQEAAEDLMNSLMKRGYPANSLHGGKDQSDRDDVIDHYKAGYFPVLVATSVAARGLDVKQLKLVVNYDCPNHLEDYVHRVGRTGRAGNKGLAVTYITENQDRFARDIAKALDMSGKPIPEELQKLVQSFAKKVEAGKENKGSTGFGGRGIERYDEQRMAQLNRERTAYGQGDMVEAEKEQQGDDEDSEMKVVVKGQGEAKESNEKQISETFTVHKREQQQQQPGAKNSMQGVTDAVAAINARLRKSGDIRHNAPIDNKGPDAGAFHATLEINDYPQKARWAVTNRTNVAKILEATGTSITSKGTFYAQGETPKTGELPKLYLLVEGDTEKVVTDAMTELIRLLKGAVEDAAASEARAPAKGGRYSVL